MSVSNIKITPTSINAKAGDTIEFKVTWDGKAEYQHYVGDRISIRGASTFTNLVKIEKQYYSGQSFSFNMKVPDDWAGSKTGWFNVVWTDSTTQVNIAVDTGVTPNCVIQATGIMNPTVSLSPSNPTIRPGEEAVFSINVGGIAAPFEIVKYEWFYKTTPIGTNSPSLSIPWSAVGYEFVLCRATIRKDGYEDAIVQGDTKLTMAVGTMDNIGIMITDQPADPIVYSENTMSSTVTGVPPNATVSYSWLENDIEISKTKDVRVYFDKMYAKRYKLIVSVYAPDYTGVTVESPEIKITPSKLPFEGVKPVITFDEPQNVPWLNYSAVRVRWIYEVAPDIKLTANIGYTAGRPFSGIVKVDGVESKTFYVDNWDISKRSDKTWLTSDMGPHTMEFDVPASSSHDFIDIPQGARLTAIVDLNVIKNDPTVFTNKVNGFVVDGKNVSSTNPFYIKSAPGEVLIMPVKHVLRNFGESTPEGDDWERMTADGVFELIDKWGNVAATAVNGVFTYKSPNEIKTLTGKLRCTLDKPEYFNNPQPMMVETPFNIEIVSNPMDPMPELEIIQTPNPVRLGSQVEYSRKFTNLPVGTDVNDSRWFVNTEAVGNGDKLARTASIDEVSIRNNTFAIPAGYDSAVITKDFTSTVLLKEWPAISLVLQPARTTVPWGEFLISGYQLFGSDSIDDRSKLVVSSPDWYLDGTSLQTIAGDGSLMVRATHPGNHVIKAVVTLRHPDYENGEKVVEQSFNMTTEKREMATTLTLLPTDAKIGIGKTQKFTATIAGAPADATTTYVWTVDGVAQSSTSNNMDYKGTTEGTKKVKVVATTSAQDAEDDVKEAEVDLIVNKNVMTLTVIASTSTPAIKLGEDYTVKCDVTGQPAGATITYKWNSGETTQSVTKTSTALGPIARKCTVTVKAADYDDAVIESNTVTVQVEKKTQATTAAISTTKPSINQLENYNATADVTGSPDGATVTYLWSTGETTKSVSKKAEKSGQIKLKCTVKVVHSDYEDKTIETNELTITVNKVAVPGVVTSITATPNPANVGEEYTVTCVVTGYPVGADVKFAWDTGETTSSIKRTPSAAGDEPHSCVITVTHEDFDKFEKTEYALVKVEDNTPVVPGECPLIDVHPLPHRSTAYIWCGWWVMREIERLTDEGKDWKTATADTSKYYCHLNVLAKMLVDYPEVDVQESRNGYIVHRTALELGIIY